MNKTEEKKISKPYEVIRAGDVSLSIWENEGKTKEGREYKYYTYQMQKSYKVGEKWEYTNTFNSQHFAKLILVLNLAMQKLLIKESEKEE